MSTHAQPRVEDQPLRAAVTALGCKVNFAEMADLAGALAAAGIEVVPEDEPADVRVLNSCAVTLAADATTRQRLRRLRRQDPGCHLVVTGCSVDANPDTYLGSRPLGVDAVFANAHKEEIAGYVVELAQRLRPAAQITATRRPTLRSREFLKVQDGCDHRCTYCTVWRARGGRSRSLPLAEVMRRATAALAEGYREVVLCGVDLGSWGRDLEPRTSLAALVEELLTAIGDARLRLSSVNANDVTPPLAALTADPRLCSHWHLPLQSGSDRVLRAMHRGYRSAQYRRVAAWLREADPDTELTTDVMVAFPGQAEDDHRATLDLIDELQFLHCHVFRFSPRPDTPAADLPDQVSDEEARRRSREVRRTAARCAQLRRQRMVGRSLEVLWERVDGTEARGISDRYHTVVAQPSARLRTGSMERVTILAVEEEYLRGTLPVAEP